MDTKVVVNAWTAARCHESRTCISAEMLVIELLSK